MVALENARRLPLRTSRGAAIEIRLFGSRARGESTTASDWDLFVVVPDDLVAADDLFAGYRLRRETRTRADIVLCPLGEFKEDRDTPNTLAYEAAHHGIVIVELDRHARAR